MVYEYKVIPAPNRGIKQKGLKTAEARYALSLQQTLSEQATEGWEFLRAETLPSEERHGLAGTVKVWHALLVFRRPAPPDPSDMTDEPSDTDTAATDTTVDATSTASEES